MPRYAFVAMAILAAAWAVAAPAQAGNITIHDGSENLNKGAATTTTVTYYGLATRADREDQENEIGSAPNQNYDLEAFLLTGTELAMVGQWNFDDGNNSYQSGDIFIDVDGDASSGSPAGFDYVFDITWDDDASAGDTTANTYDLLKLGDSWTWSSASIGASDPYRYVSGGTSILSPAGSGSFTNTIDNTLGFAGSTNHRVIAGFDLAPILASVGAPFTFDAHFTMECGNDKLLGRAAVPEPITALLLGTGLLGMAGIRRRRRR